MHKRKTTQQHGILGEDSTRLDAVLRCIGRYNKVVVRELECEDALDRRLFRKKKANARLIRAATAVSRVLHLENQVRASGDEFCHARWPLLGGVTWRVDDEDVGVCPGAVGSFLANQGGRRERSPHRCIT